jgi:hypothetical protein
MSSMITKEQYLQSLLKEIEIIKHLAGKVDASKLDYKPTEKQRSTLELMQYLGQSLKTAVTAYIAGDQAKYIELSQAPNTVTFENFISKMDEQAAFVKEAVGALTEEDLKKECTIFGNTHSLAVHLLQVLKTITAYKMQLFLYIKASGNHTIGTSNVWGGMDTPPRT